MAPTDPLLQPYQLKHLTLRNRMMSTAHEPAYSEDGMPKQRYRLYHEEKAKGGIALTMIGGSALVAPDSPPAFGNLLVYKDEIVPWFRELADGVHEHGATVMCQITHLGRRSSWSSGDWMPLVAASPVREAAHRAFPKAAEDFDIARITRAYGDAAERCQAGGLDGVEVELYGHLLDGFWSPLTNKRDDDYAGSLENRMRFSLEALTEMRQRVGPDYIIGIRMVADEADEMGLSRADGVEIARRMAASGLVDFINVIRGRVDSDETISHVIPNMGSRSAPHLNFAGEIRAETGVATFHAARINDVATARHAVASGLLDMVGMTRAHLADPHIVAKIVAGEEHRIRPCVGAGYCIDRIYEANDAFCTHNPATGREETIPHVIPRTIGKTKRAVVVGAGPGGLEAARVLAERGHSVTLFEAAGEAGGQVLLTARSDRRREIVGIVDWRRQECERLGVEFHYNVIAGRDEVLGATPDIVIVATGGLPNISFLEAGGDLVTTSWDILSGAVKPADNVLLFDDNGAHPGMQAAELIARAGSKLELATPERGLAPEIGGTNHPVYMKAIAECGVTVSLNLRLRSVRRDGNQLAATLYSDYARASVERLVDQVVVEHGTLPVDDLYFELKPDSINRGEVDLEALTAMRRQEIASNPIGAFRLYRIGDAIASRNIHAAVYDAIRLCVVM
ncbi:MAG: FAD-dependent oxidoreductase [Rhodospirillaceae bacterium]|nr:FAD-dependent oxidoreductase [Rhodospirillaceae bacterium]